MHVHLIILQGLPTDMQEKVKIRLCETRMPPGSLWLWGRVHATLPWPFLAYPYCIESKILMISLLMFVHNFMCDRRA